MPGKSEPTMNQLTLRHDPLPRERQADACVGFVSIHDVLFAFSRAASARLEGPDALVPGDGRVWR
jgi:hypothetical protein